MSEQRVVYLWGGVSVEGLVARMNALLREGLEDGTPVECIEHFDLFREKDHLCAIVLVRVQPGLHLGWQVVSEDEGAEIEARLEYETAIGVKPI